MRWPPPRTAASTSLSREPHPPGTMTRAFAAGSIEAERTAPCTRRSSPTVSTAMARFSALHARPDCEGGCPIALVHQNSDAAHAFSSLRARRERPRRGRAADERYDLAPPLIELHAIPHAERGPHCRISNWRRSVSGWPAKPRRSAPSSVAHAKPASCPEPAWRFTLAPRAIRLKLQPSSR